MSQKVFTFTCSTFLPLIVTTNPDGGETGFLQTVVAAVICYVPGCDTFYSGDSRYVMVSDVGVSLQTPAGSELRIFPC